MGERPATADDVGRTVARAIEAGVVGGNIEDFGPNDLISDGALALLQPLLQRRGTEGDSGTLPENDVSVLTRQETW